MKQPKTATARREIRRWIDAPDDVGFVEFWDGRKRQPGKAVERFLAHLYAWGQSRPAEGLRALDRITTEERRRLAPVDRARLRKMRANVLGTLGHYREAELEVAGAWKAFESLGERVEAARAGITWVSTLAHGGRLEEAEKVAQASLDRLGQRDAVLRARLRANLADTLVLSGRFRDAAREYRHVLRTMTARGSPLDVARAQYGVATCLLYQGRVAPARPLLEAAREIVRREGLALQKGLVEMQLLRADFMTGEWERVDERAKAVLKTLDQLENVRAVAFLQMEQAGLLAAVGAYRAAEPLASASLRSYTSIGQSRRAAQAAFVHGRILTALDRRIDARVRFQQALTAWRSTKDSWSQRRCEVELAAVHLARDDVSEALKLLEPAGAWLRARDRHGGAVRCQHLMAQAYLRRGETSRAVEVARQAYHDARDYPARLERPWIAQTLSEALFEDGSRAQALRWVRRAVREMEAVYFALGSRALRGQIAGAREEIYRRAVHLVLRSGSRHSARIALDFVTRSRSPQLVEDLLQESSGVRASLRAAIARLRDEMINATDLGPADVRFAHLQARIEELNETLLRQHPARSEVVRRALDERTFEAWSSRLDGRDLVVYDRHLDGWSAYVVDARRRVVRVPLPDVEDILAESWLSLRMLFETAAHLPLSSRENFLAETLEESHQALCKLRQCLWDPLPIGGDRVYVVPEGPLHGLPLEILPEVGDERGKVVVSRWPHPSVILRKRRRRAARAILLHDGTDATTHEVTRVAKLLRAEGFETEVAGSRAAFASSRRRYGMLHVAAHGAYHRDQWILNGIQLGDGWMGLEQLRRHQLKDALLYFGSCDSGLQAQWPGAEFGGWTAAGLGAGAREMVLALWKIDDEAATSFAREFYRRWTQGQDAARASAEARRAVRAHSPHPFRWAPFLTVG